MDELEANRRIDRLRGPRGGYAHAHPGLAGFWQEIAEKVAPVAPSAEETAALALLEGWFRGGPRNAVLLGEDEAFRARVLGRWALSIAAEKQVYLVFLPVGARVGTRTERDALELMMGLFPSSEAAQFTVPRSPLELKWATSLALGGRGISAEDPADDDPIVVLVVEGLDRLADAPPERLFPPLGEMDEETRVLVTASADALPFGDGSLSERLSAESGTLAQLAFPGTTPTRVAEVWSTGGSGVVEALQRRCLETLGVALAPLSTADLAWLLGLDEGSKGEVEGALSGLLHAPDGGGRGVLRRLSDGTVGFADDGLQRAFFSKTYEKEWEAKLVRRALAILGGNESSALEQLGTPGYVVEYLGAHLVRCGSGVADLMALVTPAWLSLWKRRPGCLTGFATDVRRARKVVHEALDRAADEATRASLLGDFVRCVMVEAVLFSLEGSRTARRDRSLPFVAPALVLAAQNPATTAADLRVVATLLVTLANVLDRASWGAAYELAERACGDLDSADGAILPVPIPTTAEGVVAGVPPSDELLAAGRADPEAWMRRAFRSEGYGKILHLAQVIPYLPEALRESAAAEAASAYVDGEDDDALPLLLACGPWLPVEKAIPLLDFLGNRWSTTFQRTLLGPAGIAEMVPLFKRLGGEAAVFEVARAVNDVARWLLH